MSGTVISVENLSKAYQLGQIGTGTLTNDLRLWWARLRGQPNPLLRIGESDHGNRAGETIWALRDVSFEVQQGEVLGVIGRNGAGKSTLLKILSRITAPTSGRVKVQGRIASLLEVGTGFHPELTGRENIYLNGAILGMRRDEIRRKFDEIVDFAEVEQFIDTPVKRYSSGMYVRLAFAVAAHLEPEILLVDEVLAVGDAEFQKKCLGKMSEVAHEGRTVLFVSHNMAAISQICEMVYLLRTGSIDKQGTPEEVIGYYLGYNNGLTNSLDLINHPERRTGSLRVFKSITLESPGSNSNNIVFAQKLSVIIRFALSSNISKKVVLGFNIKDSLGNIITATNMAQYKKYTLVSEIERDYIVSFTFNSLLLNPGTYSISLFIGNGAYDFDCVNNAAFFHVLWPSSSTFAHPPKPKWGPVFLQVDWTGDNIVEK